MSSKVTITDLFEAKEAKRRIAAVSCYDYTTAKLIAGEGVDMILVGDSAAQIMLGFDSTLPATMDFMVTITSAVRRGAPDIYLVADMPFLSYQPGVKDAMKNAGRFIAEAGAQMVKIEANKAYIEMVQALSEAGIAVMAHIGITPQSISRIGRFKAEATDAKMALELIALADKTIEAGASALLLEGTAAEVAEIITSRSPVPVIGCGSGLGCDGQILVAPDILGISQGKLPKFAKSYGDLGVSTVKATQKYVREVKSGKFPDKEHSYHMKKGQLEELKNLLKEKS